MGYGLTAMILLRLDGREGAWSTVHNLAGHLATTEEAVREELEPLVAQNQVRVERDLVTGEITRARVDLAGTRGLRNEAPAMSPYGWGHKR